jgi:hypothetical protein
MYVTQCSDMRYEPEHKTRTRARIVRNAARKLRAEGLSGSGVASVMKASGLTVGAFTNTFGARMSFSPTRLRKLSPNLARRSIPPCKTYRRRTGGKRSFACTSTGAL